MNKWKTIAIFFFVIVAIFCSYKIFKVFFWEPTTPRSEHDENYVVRSESIILQSTDPNDIQAEVLTYVLNEWKKVDSLYFIAVYLDCDLQLNRIVFKYQLDDVEDHEGRLEVECNNEGQYWEISRAESIYHYEQSPSYNNDYRQVEDTLLSQKIESIVRYIEAKEMPRVDLYRINIDDKNVHINAYNVEDDNSENNWKENCIFDEETLEIYLCEE